MDYVSRLFERTLKQRLSFNGGVVIDGVKACGKSEMARRFANSEYNLEENNDAKILAETSPETIFNDSSPILIDEWQIVPQVWNKIRHNIDRSKEDGKFILTGSSAPKNTGKLHSGAGRFSQINLRTMTWQELSYSDAKIKVEDLLSGRKIKASKADLDFETTADRVCKGGWPLNISRNVSNSIKANRDYLSFMTKVDVNNIADTGVNSEKLKRFFKSYSRNIATSAKVSKFVSDIKDIDRKTVNEYIDRLRRLKIIEEIPAFSVRLHSKAGLRKSPKRHLADPSLAVASLSVSPKKLIFDTRYFGFLFESLVVHDLLVFAEYLGGSLYYYLDNDGLEVDAILEIGDEFAAFEVKLGGSLIEEGAKSLMSFRKKLSGNVEGKLKSLNVVTAGNISYRREDGINVISLANLGVKA